MLSLAIDQTDFIEKKNCYKFSWILFIKKKSKSKKTK